MKHLNVTDDRKLVPRSVAPFSIIQWVRPLAYQLNLGDHYSQVHPILYVSLKHFHAGSHGYLYPTAVYVKDEQEWKASGIL